jgi:hypothetical protein
MWGFTIVRVRKSLPRTCCNLGSIESRRSSIEDRGRQYQNWSALAGGKEALDLRPQQLGPIKRLLGLMLPSAMSEMALLHSDDREVVVAHIVQVSVLAAMPDLRHIVFH